MMRALLLVTWLLAAQEMPEHTGKPGYLYSDGGKPHWREILTGPSGALCAGAGCPDGIEGTVDIVTAVVPLKATYNEFSGLNKFERLQVAVYKVEDLPKCDGKTEGLMAGVRDAREPAYNARLLAGGRAHVPVYCNGSYWTTR